MFRAIRQHPNQKELKPLLLEYGALVEERKDLIGFGRQRPYPLPDQARKPVIEARLEELRKEIDELQSQIPDNFTSQVKRLLTTQDQLYIQYRGQAKPDAAGG